MIPLLLILTGCTFTMRFPPPEEWDSADTGEPDFQDVRVISAGVTCNPTSGTWTWEAKTNGWSRAVVLDAVDTSTELGWEEQHDLGVVDSHPEGRWDKLALGPLPGAVAPEVWEPNTNTVFDCSTDRSNLTFAIRVWNHRNDLTDCIVWGHDADEVVTRLSNDPEVAEFGSCLVLSTSTTGSPP